MLKTAQWQNIKQLIDCDKKLLEVEDKIIIVNKSIADNVQSSAQLTKQAQEKQRLLVTKQKEFDENSLRLAELHEALSRKQLQIDQVKKQKEYKTLEHEIRSIEEERIILEEHTTKQGHTIDTLKKEIATSHATLSQQQEQLAQEKSALDAELSTLQSTVATNQKERASFVSALPTEWTTTYERMRRLVSDPLVPALNSCCSACFYAIPHQDFSKLKQSSIVLCRNCYRFLYYDKDAEITEQQQKF